MLSFNEALQQLSVIDNAEDLRALIAKVSVDASGNTTVLYSGLGGAGLEHVPLEISSFGGRVIDNTDSAKFLTTFGENPNTDLINKLRDIFGDDPNDRGSSSNSFLFGERVNGERIPNGAWDIASENFAAEATGNVWLVAPTGPSNGVFAQTELKAILNNSNVTEIEGIPKTQVQDLVDKHGPVKAAEALFDYSLINTHRMVKRVETSSLAVRVTISCLVAQAMISCSVH